jgi:hypothetical protein
MYINLFLNACNKISSCSVKVAMCLFGGRYTQHIDKQNDKFIFKITELYNEKCPFKKVYRNKKRNEKPWLTTGLLNAIRKRKTLYWRSVHSGKNIDDEKYKIYRNKLTSILRKAECKYYSDLLMKHKNDVKSTWKVLNKCIKRAKTGPSYPEVFENNGVKSSNCQENANGFNSLFANIGPNLAKSIPNSNEYQYSDFVKYNAMQSMYVKPTCKDEVVSVIKGFKSKQSTDVNDVNMFIVKKLCERIAQPLTHICNISFENGVFPNKMKISKIIPLFKAGSRQSFTNYRPVSLLPQFSKILEKLFNNRLVNFVEQNNVFYAGQYGFRNNHSTSLALMDLMEEITTSLDRKQTTVGVLIDLKKAFDTIDHGILIKKLYIYGVRGIALKWLESYLKDRLQYIMLNDSNFGLINMLCGFPQGSILGPTLFFYI